MKRYVGRHRAGRGRPAMRSHKRCVVCRDQLDLYGGCWVPFLNHDGEATGLRICWSCSNVVVVWELQRSAQQSAKAEAS